MEVMNILSGFRENAMILVVTHDRSILSGADQVIEMWDGRIL
jgi:putative ABC transport system ATP-binding protein